MGFEVIDRNLRQTMQVFALASEAGCSVALPGLELVCSGIDHPVFNVALLSSAAGLDELGARIEAAANYFAGRRLRWSFWACEDWLERRTRSRLAALLAERGLRLLTEAPGMVAERLSPRLRRLPELEFRPVCDPATRMDFCHIASSVFQLPTPVAAGIYGGERFWSGPFAAWVGYAGGQAVTTTGALAADGVIGIYSVATLPAQRCRGCAEAAVRYVLGELKRRTGLERTVLQSSSLGFSLYKRLGYRPVSRFVIYSSA